MVITSIASLQCGSALSTKLFDQLGVAGTNFLRTLAGALVLCLLARPIPGRDRTDRVLLLGFGAIVALTSIAFYSAIDRLPLGIAVTVEFSGPLTVAVLASRRRLDVAWAALAAVGVLLLSGALEGGPVDRVGLAFAFLSAAGWAAYILVGQRVGRRMPELGAIATSTVIAAIILIPSGIAGASSEMLSPGPLATAVAIGVLSVAVPISLEVSALRTLPSRVYGILTSLEPALAALAGLVLLGQHLGARDAVAICCVVVASLGAARSLPPVPAEF
jgi:inner membrane transporter RhtA